MEAILYVPYSNGDCVNGFRYEGRNMSATEYSKMVTDEYNKYKNSIDHMVYTRMSRNMSINDYEKLSNIYKQQTFYYNECDCKISDIKGNNQDIDGLIHFYHTKETFVLILDLLNMTREMADVDTEMKMWSKESLKISNSNRLTNEEKIFNLPKKDFKVKLKKERQTAILKDCKLFKVLGMHKYAVMVGKIIFVKD